MSERSHKCPQHRHRRDMPRLVVVWLLTLLLALAAMAISAAAAGCPTTVTTTLSGESKEGETITVDEGAAIKDQATLSGFNSGKAGGTVTYSVYSDKECKALVTKAGEVTVSSGKVPASSEEKPSAGTYYWQASYKGDEANQPGTSTCGSEIATVKASTSLTTQLLGEESSGEATEGDEITLGEGAIVVDNATLSGAHAGSAEGTVTYDVYSDKECKTLAAKAGEVSVSEGVVPISEQVTTLSAGTYYWQASYSGDSLDEPSKSKCGSEVLIVKDGTTLTTSLSGEGQEGGEIRVDESAGVSDKATLSGSDALMATGTAKYAVYSDAECKELVAKAGEVTVNGESVPASNKETLPAGAYFWQATYSGDTLDVGSKSSCGLEILIVGESVTTHLSGEGQSGEEVDVQEGSGVSDQATLHGEHAATATGTVKYSLYFDSACKELAGKAGEVTVTSGKVPASSEDKLKEGDYYWQASYKGDESNPAGTSACASEVATVQPSTTVGTSLWSNGSSGDKLEVQEGVGLSDKAKLMGPNVTKATGYVRYFVYSDSACKELVAEAGNVVVTNGSVPSSSEKTLPVGTYYWQAVYTGDTSNHGATSSCGAEISTVTAPITTKLSGGGQSGNEVEVPGATKVGDTAKLNGTTVGTATGTVKYNIYSESKCRELFGKAGEVTVTGGVVPESNGVKLNAGTYYWQAAYSGDSSHAAATSACGVEVAIVQQSKYQYASLGDSFSSGEGTGQYYENTNKGLFSWNKNLCHRSTLAWPARVAKALFGPNVTTEQEVLKQQPPSFIFRACSGAVLDNMWSLKVNAATLGKYEEPVLNQGSLTWFSSKPAQDLWLELPGGVTPGVNSRPNNAITLVTLTSGGNDAGFATIARRCINGPPILGYNRANCLAIIKEWEKGERGAQNTLLPPRQEGLPSIAEKLPVVLTNIHAAAPMARIRIPLYPQIVDTAVLGEIKIATGYSIENVARNNEVSVAMALALFESELNRKIQTTVEAWAKATRVNAQVIPGTVNALVGHQLGDATPWVNGLAGSFFEETFHPKCLGHIALAEQVLKSLGRATPAGWRC
jgi:hypothetical protein